MANIIKIRRAHEGDAALIVEFMKKLGEYQRMLEKTVITEEKAVSLLEDGAGEAIFAELYNDKIPSSEGHNDTVGFMYFYMNSTAFTGEKGIYIDAFYINEEVRGKGIGKQMMQYMSRLALDRGCSRLEWVCLDWNLPSIGFYKKLGSSQMNMFTTYRMDKAAILRNSHDIE